MALSRRNLELLARAAAFARRYAVRETAERLGAHLLGGAPFIEDVAKHMCEKENGAGSWSRGTSADRARWTQRATSAVEGIIALIPKPSLGGP